MNLPPASSDGEALVDEGLDVVAEGGGDEEARQQCDDGVGDALAKFVEVLEERHPPFERIEFIAERR